jgi:hypothetical protein
MVWDTIYGRGPTPEPVEEWGGIAYALAALEAALLDDWEIIPLVRVGRDLAPRADAFLQQLSRRAPAARFIEVPEPNNRVTLRYTSAQRRTERLSGGVPPWTWTELGPLVRDLDALYVNFITGFELDLATAQQLRYGFPGPIYADLHSLLLGVSRQGDRFPQPLPDVHQWFTCFDVVQLNEEEMRLVGAAPMAVAAAALAHGVRLLVVTLAARGAVYFTVRPFTFGRQPAPPSGPIETARIPAFQVPAEGDATGCGDVFGGTLVAQLLRSTPLERALQAANEAAGRNLQHRGAGKLQYHLRGELAPR